MTLDPQVQIILDGLAAGAAGAADAPPVSEQTPEQVRASFELLGQLGGDDAVAATDDVTLAGAVGDLRARVYRPSDDTSPQPALVYFHGGGFVIGDIGTHDAVCRSLAARSGATVVSVDYRLAPEHRFPAAADDAVAAFDDVRARASELGLDPARLATGGDSAGGNLAALVANERRGEVAFQLLIYPVTDLTRTSASYRDNAEGYLLTAELMDWFEGHYTGGAADLTDPRLSPLFVDDLSGVAPAFVLTAEYDPLRDEGEAYAARLEAAGVEVTTRRYDGMIHGFIQMGSVIARTDVALDELSTALRDALT